MKYRLKRDLPGYTAGEDDFERDDDSGHWTASRQRIISWKWSMFDEALDSGWFEPIKEAEKRYYHIKMYPSKNYVEDSVFDYVNSYTEAQAEAVAEAIKALLEYVHADNYNLTDEGEAAHIREVLYKARKAVQEEA